jgi:hypothetical protein
METALLMGTLLTQVQAMTIVGGASPARSRRGGRDAVVALRPPRQPRLFFQVTAIFLLVFVGAAADLRLPRAHRSELFPEQRSAALGDRAVRPDGVYGQYLTYLLVAMPLSWLLFSMATGANRTRSAPRTGRAASRADR